MFLTSPTPVVTWKRLGEDKELAEHRMGTAENLRNEFIIKDVIQGDEGQYECSGTNNVTTQEKKVVFNLTVEGWLCLHT